MVYKVIKQKHTYVQIVNLQVNDKNRMKDILLKHLNIRIIARYINIQHILCRLVSVTHENIMHDYYNRKK